MAFRRGVLSLLAAALLVQPAHGAAPILGEAVERQVHADGQRGDLPGKGDEAAAMNRLAAYVMALEKRDFAAAYAMLRLSLQAATPRLEWQENMRKRGSIWADGTLSIIRLSWYLDPAGQPPGLYAAFDFKGVREGGMMDCGYVVVHRASPDATFTVVRTDLSEVPPQLIEDGVPKAEVLRQLPCYLGKTVATAL